MCVSGLRNWPIFSSLEPDFISQIHMVFVYGEMGRETLMVMKNKMVYAMGNNVNGCLGIGDTNSTLYPRKVKALCKKNIKTFAYGNGSHVLALTKEGEIYSWGYNDHGELGHGIYYPVFTPTLVFTPGNSVGFTRIVDIACGSHHSVALTEFGKVYVWGDYFGQVSNDNIIDQSIPRQVDSSLARKKVVCISCGNAFTMAVVENGEVFAWGNNYVGQLGLDDLQTRMTPCWVDSLKGTVIVKVACGFEHTLALTDEGDLYSWGRDPRSDDKGCPCIPFLVKHKMGKISDIAAVKHVNIAISEGGRVYIWGNCHGQRIMIPTATTFSNMYDAFACYGSPSVMHKPLILYSNEEPRIECLKSVLECMGNSFNDEHTSDLTIQVEGQSIFVHKAILKIRCTYFRNMFQHDWMENNQSVIELDQFSYVIYKAFLKYLYTGMIALPMEKTIELLNLADVYCENNLKKHCIRIIKQGISVLNVAYLYSVAVQYNEEELEEFCIRFAINHMTAVTQTESFANLNGNTLKTFIIKIGKAGVFKT
ncbi:PREDICTED: RCC1 and BTB domain-containing protein 1-like [Trachymyrmex cornetzi]|uniref:RCC1 and BTB domain-containing protein 1-like n=1 Tax=Trachymyrmex cornetzi TaxID=471704 RepID=UPI00084F7C2E|nr:PREDICTED: RCC1 and BTB domain-containing protein 1-like [Trachymyrmex cornetzi]